ncbi:MAG TPA: CHAD domain-containing protein [Bryobacteraceae bacterium]|nr:CHAD domain-containing protein [Bryobacteraceae bacterium]
MKSAKPQWDKTSDAVANAQAVLPKLLADYFQLGREVLASNPAPPELHQLRLASKKLRYTLELFKGCYGPGFGERINALKTLQQMLGEINDTVAAERTIGGILVADTEESRRAVDYLRNFGRDKAKAFRKHWTTVFDAPGQERWWTEYLARQAGKNGKRGRNKTRG